MKKVLFLPPCKFISSRVKASLALLLALLSGSSIIKASQNYVTPYEAEFQEEQEAVI